MNFELPDLPYAHDALEPHISARTLGIHHGKHHQSYLNALKKALADGKRADDPLELIVLDPPSDLFNPAAQAWNHTFYWQSMTPGGSPPSAAFATAISADFGSVEALHDALKKAAVGEFGSGWAWLLYDTTKGRMDVQSSSDAGNPLVSGRIPLLTVDVWEHAYYLDYQQARGDYVNAVVEHLLDFTFAERNYETFRNRAASEFRLAGV